jgi:hypothetical protein
MDALLGRSVITVVLSSLSPISLCRQFCELCLCVLMVS